MSESMSGENLYFAYGSNLDCGQMKQRCPSASFVARAVLRDHELCFPRFSSTWEGGVASVCPKEGENVWGVLYRLSDGDLQNLDRYEGAPPYWNAYRRNIKTVYVDNDDDKPLEAWVYVANPEPDGPFPPSRSYLDTIISGAEFWKIPEDYVAGLRSIPTC